MICFGNCTRVRSVFLLFFNVRLPKGEGGDVENICILLVEGYAYHMKKTMYGTHHPSHWAAKILFIGQRISCLVQQ